MYSIFDKRSNAIKHLYIDFVKKKRCFFGGTIWQNHKKRTVNTKSIKKKHKDSKYGGSSFSVCRKSQTDVSSSVPAEEMESTMLHYTVLNLKLIRIYSLLRCAVCQMIFKHLTLIGETYALYRECDLIDIKKN